MVGPAYLAWHYLAQQCLALWSLVTSEQVQEREQVRARELAYENFTQKHLF
jgi:hypothetical protein